MNRRKITNAEINEIFLFVRKAIAVYREAGVPNLELIIALPEWLKEVIIYFNRAHFNSSTSTELLHSQFFGVETQPHFKDEVVVFVKRFDSLGELYEPFIHQIKFEDN